MEQKPGMSRKALVNGCLVSAGLWGVIVAVCWSLYRLING